MRADTRSLQEHASSSPLEFKPCHGAFLLSSGTLQRPGTRCQTQESDLVASSGCSHQCCIANVLLSRITLREWVALSLWHITDYTCQGHHKALEYLDTVKKKKKKKAIKTTYGPSQYPSDKAQKDISSLSVKDKGCKRQPRKKNRKCASNVLSFLILKSCMKMTCPPSTNSVSSFVTGTPSTAGLGADRPHVSGGQNVNLCCGAGRGFDGTHHKPPKNLYCLAQSFYF